MATGTITDKINNVVALLIDQCNCGTPSEIKAAFQELQAALNAQFCKTLDVSFQSRSRESTTRHSSQGSALGERNRSGQGRELKRAL